MANSREHVILLPSLRQEYLGKGGNQVESFTYRKELTMESLMKEISGQPHLRTLRKALSPDRRIYLLKGDREELMQLAAEYIGNYHRLLGGEQYQEAYINPDGDEEEEMEDEIPPESGESFLYDFSAKLPVLNASDLIEQNDPGFLPMGGVGYRMDQHHNPRPWWTWAEEAPLCVRLNSYIEELPKILQDMEERRLIILWQTVERREHHIDMEEWQSYMNSRMEKLAFQLECEPICLTAPDETSSYKQQVLRQLARQRGTAIAGGDTAKRVLKIVRESRRDVDNQTLNRTIGNALVRRKKNSNDRCKTLTVKDFRFLQELAPVGKLIRKTEGTELICQDHIKAQLESIVNQMLFQRRRAALGLPTEKVHNVLAFMGAPGTGKTSWAKYLAGRMAELNLLRDTDMICLNAAELKAKYVGHTTARVKSIFENYGVIILDEAYSLAGSADEDSFGKEALAQLCVELEEHGTDRLVIFAGYGGSKYKEDNPMARFMQANPGISSRISFKVFFDDFTPEQLKQVFHSMLRIGGYTVSAEADNELEHYFRTRMGARAFGNCREARNLADRAKACLADRLVGCPELDRDQASCITADDVRKAVREVLEEYTSLQRDSGTTVGF